MNKVYLLYEDNDYDSPSGRGPNLISIHETREGAEIAQSNRFHGEANYIEERTLKK